ncbi:MAG: hypothetical protein ACE5IM_01285, partial [Nitrospinota bacterium]
MSRVTIFVSIWLDRDTEAQTLYKLSAVGFISQKVWATGGNAFGNLTGYKPVPRVSGRIRSESGGEG